uniref:Uncharacterized protein n=1 Tax=Marseillevirus LCMAC101 TaxID=2506602 RepID=A0A481YUF7_9VIRU|nr:MAG: hypothetical protein LCMAC101_07310 [Marseillevirus LCMAC101]
MGLPLYLFPSLRGTTGDKRNLIGHINSCKNVFTSNLKISINPWHNFLILEKCFNIDIKNVALDETFME